ncbi:ENV1 protein, partial [Formicarius rufipectus]|nr:ENV1 protein [Formicarius rufipectus]
TKAPNENPLWEMMEASFKVLNASHSNFTEHCWLCFGARPPFYETIGVDTMPTQETSINPTQCDWNTKREKITLTQVKGKAVCMG